MTNYLMSFYDLSLDAAPYLVLGLMLAGLMRAWIPDAMLNRQLGKPGVSSIFKASIIGAPLPLCSCGVLPVAMGLRRAGASKGSTVSFLISTPETGVDSVALSYGLLGPLMAVVRPLAAVTTAITAGLLTGWSDDNQPPAAPSTSSCCASKASPARETWRTGLNYSFGKLFDDMLPWLLVGLLFAAAVQAFVPQAWLQEWGQGPLAMLVMLVIGIPMYICASASTPIAAGFLLAGVSPGAVRVFLLAGPASNIAAVGMVHKELGRRALLAYLFAVATMSMLFGLGLDSVLANTSLSVDVTAGHQHDIVPLWLSLTCLLLLVVCAIKPLRRMTVEKGLQAV